jgi:hypothetical protein|uniref:RAB11 binding and LisH domain, coiled-coil and HEAT repeat containing n=1 Tax=Castor canadensis TaxID=51338 RepID=A0A8C0XQX9_CASCN
MAAMAPGGSGGGGVNPFLSDSEEEDDEVAATEERRAGLRLGAGVGLDPGSAGSLSPQDPVALGSSTRPGLPGEASVALGGSGETPARLSIDAIAAQLLRDQYLLTALELHTELLESGRELPRLRDYFSNPGNFERQSGTPPGMGAPGVPGAAGVGGAGGREPSTTSGGGQLSEYTLPATPAGLSGMCEVTMGKGRECFWVGTESRNVLGGQRALGWMGGSLSCWKQRDRP